MRERERKRKKKRKHNRKGNQEEGTKYSEHIFLYMIIYQCFMFSLSAY